MRLERSDNKADYVAVLEAHYARAETMATVPNEAMKVDMIIPPLRNLREYEAVVTSINKMEEDDAK